MSYTGTSTPLDMVALACRKRHLKLRWWKEEPTSGLYVHRLDNGSYTIIKAQAHAYSGDIEKGVNLAIQGIGLAKGYKSERHISRVQGMYDRLQITPIGKHPLMKNLKEVLMSI